MTLGEHLRRLRQERGLTQAALALRSGVPPSSIRHVEKGYRQPSREWVATLMVKGLRLIPEEADRFLREWRFVEVDRTGRPASRGRALTR